MVRQKCLTYYKELDMTRKIILPLTLILCLIAIGLVFCSKSTKEIQRPEKIVSKRQIIYDDETYKKLTELWKKYYKEFPSEDAYANWMYALRYSQNPDFEKLTRKGLKKYPANPTLLHLASCITIGSKDNAEAIANLEKAVQLDPKYTDPWFNLVSNYMINDDWEKTDLALKKLLEANAISEEVMDYNYNMLALLEPNAILVTNGDNDTYPGWILTRIVKFRPDVLIANRSLLNTDWYPLQLIRLGAPAFISSKELEELYKDFEASADSKKSFNPNSGPFGDILILKLLASTKPNKRPVYLSATLAPTPTIDSLRQHCRNLGLVALITTSEISYKTQLAKAIEIWLTQFRTSGLDSWKMKYASPGDAGKMMLFNYTAGMFTFLDSVQVYYPNKALPLFNWYLNHSRQFSPPQMAQQVDSYWCKFSEVPQIISWCQSQGLLK
jgi:tetratricopeptide (TPR) repeat protein